VRNLGGVQPEEIQLLKSILLSEVGVRNLETTNPYEVFRVEYENCLIVGYTTGKIVANKENARRLIAKGLPKLSTEVTKPTIIGSDEAGKGEWLGYRFRPILQL